MGVPIPGITVGTADAGVRTTAEGVIAGGGSGSGAVEITVSTRDGAGF